MSAHTMSDSTTYAKLMRHCLAADIQLDGSFRLPNGEDTNLRGLLNRFGFEVPVIDEEEAMHLACSWPFTQKEIYTAFSERE